MRTITSAATNVAEDVFARNEHRATALHYSSVEGCLEVSKALLSKVEEGERSKLVTRGERKGELAQTLHGTGIKWYQGPRSGVVHRHPLTSCGAIIGHAWPGGPGVVWSAEMGRCRCSGWIWGESESSAGSGQEPRSSRPV